MRSSVSSVAGSASRGMPRRRADRHRAADGGVDGVRLVEDVAQDVAHDLAQVGALEVEHDAAAGRLDRRGRAARRRRAAGPSPRRRCRGRCAHLVLRSAADLPRGRFLHRRRQRRRAAGASCAWAARAARASRARALASGSRPGAPARTPQATARRKRIGLVIVVIGGLAAAFPGTTRAPATARRLSQVVAGAASAARLLVALVDALPLRIGCSGRRRAPAASCWR